MAVRGAKILQNKIFSVTCCFLLLSIAGTRTGVCIKDESGRCTDQKSTADAADVNELMQMRIRVGNSDLSPDDDAPKVEEPIESADLQIMTTPYATARDESCKVDRLGLIHSGSSEDEELIPSEEASEYSILDDGELSGEEYVRNYAEDPYFHPYLEELALLDEQIKHEVDEEALIGEDEEESDDEEQKPTSSQELANQAVKEAFQEQQTNGLRNRKRKMTDLPEPPRPLEFSQISKTERHVSSAGATLITEKVRDRLNCHGKYKVWIGSYNVAQQCAEKVFEKGYTYFLISTKLDWKHCEALKTAFAGCPDGVGSHDNLATYRVYEEFKPIIFDMYPMAGSIAGGQLVTFRGAYLYEAHDKMEGKKDTASALKAPIQILMTDRQGLNMTLECPLENFESRVADVKCVTPALSEKEMLLIDSKLFILILKLTPTGLEQVRRPTAPDVNEVFAYSYSTGATPELLSVSPVSAGPGDVITMQGFSCSGVVEGDPVQLVPVASKNLSTLNNDAESSELVADPETAYGHICEPWPPLKERMNFSSANKEILEKEEDSEFGALGLDAIEFKLDSSSLPSNLEKWISEQNIVEGARWIQPKPWLDYAKYWRNVKQRYVARLSGRMKIDIEGHYEFIYSVQRVGYMKLNGEIMKGTYSHNKGTKVRWGGHGRIHFKKFLKEGLHKVEWAHAVNMDHPHHSGMEVTYKGPDTANHWNRIPEDKLRAGITRDAIAKLEQTRLATLDHQEKYLVPSEEIYSARMKGLGSGTCPDKSPPKLIQFRCKVSEDMEPGFYDIRFQDHEYGESITPETSQWLTPTLEMATMKVVPVIKAVSEYTDGKMVIEGHGLDYLEDSPVSYNGYAYQKLSTTQDYIELIPGAFLNDSAVEMGARGLLREVWYAYKFPEELESKGEVPAWMRASKLKTDIMVAPGYEGKGFAERLTGLMVPPFSGECQFQMKANPGATQVKLFFNDVPMSEQGEAKPKPGQPAKVSPYFFYAGRAFTGSNNWEDLSSVYTGPPIGGAMSIAFTATFKGSNFKHCCNQRIIDFGNGAHKQNIYISRDHNHKHMNFYIHEEKGHGYKRAHAHNVIRPDTSQSWLVTVTEGGVMSIFLEGILVGRESNGYPPPKIHRKYLKVAKSNWGGNHKEFAGEIKNLQFIEGAVSWKQVYGEYDKSEVSFKTVRYGVTCEGHGDKNFGYKPNIVECAKEAKKNGYTFFSFGRYHRYGTCMGENTAECSKFWNNNEYDVYKVTKGESETAKPVSLLPFPEDPVVSVTDDQLAKSSYFELKAGKAYPFKLDRRVQARTQDTGPTGWKKLGLKCRTISGGEDMPDLGDLLLPKATYQVEMKFKQYNIGVKLPKSNASYVVKFKENSATIDKDDGAGYKFLNLFGPKCTATKSGGATKVMADFTARGIPDSQAACGSGQFKPNMDKKTGLMKPDKDLIVTTDYLLRDYPYVHMCYKIGKFARVNMNVKCKVGTRGRHQYFSIGMTDGLDNPNSFHHERRRGAQWPITVVNGTTTGQWECKSINLMAQLLSWEDYERRFYDVNYGVAKSNPGHPHAPGPQYNNMRIYSFWLGSGRHQNGDWVRLEGDMAVDMFVVSKTEFAVARSPFSYKGVLPWSGVDGAATSSGWVVEWFEGKSGFLHKSGAAGKPYDKEVAKVTHHAKLFLDGCGAGKPEIKDCNHYGWRAKTTLDLPGNTNVRFWYWNDDHINIFVNDKKILSRGCCVRGWHRNVGYKTGAAGLYKIEVQLWQGGGGNYGFIRWDYNGKTYEVPNGGATGGVSKDHTLTFKPLARDRLDELKTFMEQVDFVSPHAIGTEVAYSPSMPPPAIVQVKTPPVKMSFTDAVKIGFDGPDAAVRVDVGKAKFNAMFQACPVVKYTHNAELYAIYKRTSAIPSDFDAYTLFTKQWASKNNKINTDFELYSTEAELSEKKNPWKVCNYDYPKIGFPRDCGKTGHQGGKWFKMPDEGGASNAFATYGFEIQTGSCASPIGAAYAPPKTATFQMTDDATTIAAAIMSVGTPPLEVTTLDVEGMKWLDMSKMTARQSSVYGHGHAKNALDGRPSLNDWGQHSCTHTNHDKNAWWSVNFGKKVNVQKVKIGARNCCTHHQLRDAIISVDGKVCHPKLAIGDRETKTVNCFASGSTLSVMLPKKDHLVICEVGVGTYDDVPEANFTAGSNSFGLKFTYTNTSGFVPPPLFSSALAEQVAVTTVSDGSRVFPDLTDSMFRMPHDTPQVSFDPWSSYICATSSTKGCTPVLIPTPPPNKTTGNSSNMTGLLAIGATKSQLRRHAQRKWRLPARFHTEESLEKMRRRVFGYAKNVVGWSETSSLLQMHAGHQGNFTELDPRDDPNMMPWSDPKSWGGEAPPNKESTDIVYIPEGKTAKLDMNVNIRFWVIEGNVVWDMLKNIHMEAEAIVVNGGQLLIGSESKPYAMRGQITLHGHWHTFKLPLCGAKTIFQTRGNIEMHGIPVPITWTELETTAFPLDMSITVFGSLDWQPGNMIVIAASDKLVMDCRLDRRDNCQVEERYISDIEPGLESDAERGGPTTIIYLDRPLVYRHVAEELNAYFPDEYCKQKDLDPKACGKTQVRAEVGLLSRNIVVKGSNYHDGSGPAGSEGFGGHLMHAEKAKYSYIEFFWMGQAFQMGRYPLHFHLTGFNPTSYIKGCSLHRTFMRGITVHGTHSATIKDNVLYNVMAHGYFIEDGNEHNNLFENNLGMMVHKSFSALVSDQTPAVFWLRNPSNYFRNNHAAGGAAFGFWFDTLGVSSQLGIRQFDHNTAHSNGNTGIWIDIVDPREGCTADPDWTIKVPSRDDDGISRPVHDKAPSCGGPREIVKLQHITTWGNGRFGMTLFETGHLHLINHRSIQDPTGILVWGIRSDDWPDPTNNFNGPTLLHGVYSSKSALPASFRSSCSIGGPWDDTLMLYGTQFIGGVSRGHFCPCFECLAMEGGYETRTAKLGWHLGAGEVTSKRASWPWLYASMFFDMDGTLTEETRDCMFSGCYLHAPFAGDHAGMYSRRLEPNETKLIEDEDEEALIEYGNESDPFSVIETTRTQVGELIECKKSLYSIIKPDKIHANRYNGNRGDYGKGQMFRSNIYFDGDPCYCGHRRSDDYVEYDLGKPTWVTGVQTRGRRNHDQWVKYYQVQYTEDGTKWVMIDKLFTGNRNRNSIVENRFQPIKAVKIRLITKSWHSHNCFRLDFLGCDGSLPLTMTCMDSPYLDTNKRNCATLERTLGAAGMKAFCESDAGRTSMYTALSAKQACCACGAGVNVVAQNVVPPNGTTDEVPDNAPIKVVPGGTGYFDPKLCKQVDYSGGIVCLRQVRMNSVTVKSAGIWHMMTPIEVQSDFGFAEMKLAFCYQQYEFTVMQGNRFLIVPPYTPKMLVDWDMFDAEIKMSAGDAYVFQWETIHNPDGYTVKMSNVNKKAICDKAPMQYDADFNNNQTLIDILKTETDMHSVQKLKLSQGFIFDMYKVAHLPLLDRAGEADSAGMWGYIQANESYDFRYWYPGMFNVLITEKGVAFSGNHLGPWDGRKKNPAEVWPTRNVNMRSEGAGMGFSQIKTPMHWQRWDLALPPPPGQKPPPQLKMSRLLFLVTYCGFNPASFGHYSDAAVSAVANHTDVKNKKVTVPAMRKFKWSEWPADLGGKPKLVDNLGFRGQGLGNVSIEANWEVTLDEDVDFVNKLNISGVLKFEDKAGCCKLVARYIMVGPLFGKIEAGTESKPFSTGVAHIILKGQPMTPPLRHFRPHIWGSAKWLKSKFLAVQGSLSLHGATRSKTWAKLAKTAPAGSPSITVEGGDFKVGDVIALDHGAETKTVKAVVAGKGPPSGPPSSGTIPGVPGGKTPGTKTGLSQTDANETASTSFTLLLDSPIKKSYKGADHIYEGKSDTIGLMAAHVGIVDGYNVIVEGEDTPGVPMCDVSKFKKCPYQNGLGSGGGGMNLHDFAKEMRHYLEKTGAAQHPNCRPCLAVSEMAFAGYIIGMAHFHYINKCPKDHGVIDVTGVVFKHGSNLRLYHGFTGGNYPDGVGVKNFPAAWDSRPYVWWKDPVWKELNLDNPPVPEHQIAYSAFNNTHTGAAFALANAGVQVFPTKPVMQNVILSGAVGVNGAARPIRDIGATHRDKSGPLNDNLATMTQGVGAPTDFGTFGFKGKYKQGMSDWQFVSNFLIGSTLTVLRGGGGSKVVRNNVINGPVYLDGCPTTTGQTCFSDNIVNNPSTSGCIFMRSWGKKGVADNTVFGCRIGVAFNYASNRQGTVRRMKILDSNVGLHYWALGPDSKTHNAKREEFEATDLVIYARPGGGGTGIRNPKVHSHLLGQPVPDWWHGGTNVFPMGHAAPCLFFKSMLYNITFVGFNKAAGGVAISVGEGHQGDSSDADYYPVLTRDLTFDSTSKDAYMRFAKPSNMGNSGTRQCLQIECDGRRNSLIIDEDGSLIGTPGTVISAPYRFYDKMKYVDPMGFDTMEDLIPMPARYDAVGDAIPFPTGVPHGTGGGLEYECNEQMGCDVLFMQRYGDKAGQWLPDFNKTLSMGERIVAIREDGGHIFLDPLHHGWDYALSTVYTNLCKKTMDPSWSAKPESQHARRYGRVDAFKFGSHINASKIPATIGPVYTVPGIYRKGCTYNADWGSYECPKSKHRHLLIEVMDWNHMVRRWAPVSVEVNDGYWPQGGSMNILTGPAMYWTSPMMRLQSFHALGHIGLRHNVYFSADPPSHLRLHLQHASPTEGVVVCVYYGLPNLIQAYVGGSKKEPLTIPTWDNLVFAYLNSSMPHGTYYYDRIGVETRRPGYLYVVIRGDKHADFKISHKIVLTSKVTVTSTWGGWKDDKLANGSDNPDNNDFYKKGINGLVRNIALLIGAPPNKVAILGQGKAKHGTFWNNDTTSEEFAKWMWKQNKSMDRKTMKEWLSTPGASLKNKSLNPNNSLAQVRLRHAAFLQQFSEESRGHAAEALIQGGPLADTYHHKMSLLSSEEELMVREKRVSDMLENQGETHYQSLRLMQESAWAEEGDDDNDTFTIIFDSESDVVPATINADPDAMRDASLLELHDVGVTQLKTEDKGMGILENCVPNGTEVCTLPSENGTISIESATTDSVPTKNNPKGWTCAESAYDDGAVCDCDCGIWDPDCDRLAFEIDPALLNSTNQILLLDHSQAKMAIGWVDKNFNRLIDADEELSIPTLGASALYGVAETIIKAQEMGGNQMGGGDRKGNFAWMETVATSSCNKLLSEAPLTPKLATYTPKCVKDTIFEPTLGQPSGRCSIQPKMKIGSQCHVPGGGFYPAPARGVNQTNDGSVCGAVLKIFRGGLGAGGTMSTGTGPSSAHWFHPGGNMVPKAAGVLAPINMKTVKGGLDKMAMTNSFKNGFSFYCRIKFSSWTDYGRIFSFYSKPKESKGPWDGRLEAMVHNSDHRKTYEPKMNLLFYNENWRRHPHWHRNSRALTPPVPLNEEMQLLFTMSKEKLVVIKNGAYIAESKVDIPWDSTPDFSKVDMFIGRKAEQHRHYLDAEISDIRVWTRPVTWDVAVQGVPPSADNGNPPPDDDGEDLEVPCLSSKLNTYDFACQYDLSKELAEQLGYGEQYRAKIETDKFEKRAKMGDITICTDKASTKGVVFAGKFGDGLTAEYYRMYTHCHMPPFTFGQVPAIVRVDKKVEVPSDFKAPLNQFAIRWGGKLLIHTAGDYEFQVTANDGAWLAVDSFLVVNAEGCRSGSSTRTETSSKTTMSAGGHDIAVLYFNRGPEGNSNDAKIVLKYKGADTGGNMVVIPTENLGSDPLRLAKLSKDTGEKKENETEVKVTPYGKFIYDEEYGVSLMPKGSCDFYCQQGKRRAAAAHFKFFCKASTEVSFKAEVSDHSENAMLWFDDKKEVVTWTLKSSLLQTSLLQKSSLTMNETIMSNEMKFNASLGLGAYGASAQGGRDYTLATSLESPKKTLIRGTHSLFFQGRPKETEIFALKYLMFEKGKDLCQFYLEGKDTHFDQC